MSRDLDFESSRVPARSSRFPRLSLRCRQRNGFVSPNHRFEIQHSGISRILQGLILGISVNVEALQRRTVGVERLAVWFDDDINVKFEGGVMSGGHAQSV